MALRYRKKCGKNILNFGKIGKIMDKNVAKQNPQERMVNICREADKLQITQDLAINVANSFTAANVMLALRETMTDQVVERYFRPLAGQKFGFRTDRNNYPTETLRSCIIDAILLGLAPTGNQFNIISGNCYPTKEGYTNLLKKIGVDYKIEILPNTSQDNSYAIMPCRVTYTYGTAKNAKWDKDIVIPKKGNENYDLLAGKANKRIKQALYEYLTGTDWGYSDDEIVVEASANNNRMQQPQPQVQPQAQAQVVEVEEVIEHTDEEVLNMMFQALQVLDKEAFVRTYNDNNGHQREQVKNFFEQNINRFNK